MNSFEQWPEDNNRDNEHVKKITLSSGKEIEIVYFDDLIQDVSDQASSLVPDENPAKINPENTASSESGLCNCPDCNSNLVYPTDWEEEGLDQWYIERHCPNCDWTDGRVFDHELDRLDEYDEELDRGTEELASDLGRLARANMADDVERFVDALKADAIQPMDF